MEQKEIIINESIKPISLPKQKEITRQMEKCVCKIYKNGNNGSGFFAQIPYKDSQIKVLITNNHVLEESDIQEGKNITFSINNDIKNITIGKERKKYTSEKYDTTIIEIKGSDELEDITEYLEIDDINLKYIKESNKPPLNETLNYLYKQCSLYTLNYLGGKEIFVSYGFFIKITGSNIYHKCSTDFGSSGSPILSLENNKLIGVHYGSSKNNLNNFNFNKGTLIAFPIIEFQDIKNVKTIIPKKLNSMNIRYKINNEDIKLRLFGEIFVKNNKNNCNIIIDGKTQELTEHIIINENMKKNGYLEIKLKEKSTITNMSHMFCRGIEENDKMLLIKISDIDKWETTYVTNMSYLFCCCEELESLPNISSWNTSNVEDMSNMISYCPKIESLPDISKWDTKNVRNMSHMFANDSALKSIPDISKWNVSKVKDTEHMFTHCSISEIPDISKWDMSNIKNLSYMFSYCRQLTKVPNIPEWNIIDANVRGMFYGCISFMHYHADPEESDISKWKITNDKLWYIFYYCNENYPGIGWKILNKISNTFKIGKRYIEVWNYKGTFNY